MFENQRGRGAAAAVLAGAVAMAPTGVASAHRSSETVTGPTSSASPYVLPVATGVSITSLLTVGDSPAGSGYRMVGIPDGLGARQVGRGRLEVLVNHELRDTVGAVRSHGQPGAFVSRWTLNPKTGVVSSGSDLIQSVRYWQYGTPGQYGSAPVAPAGAVGGHTLAFSRFCSGYLSEEGELRNRRTGRGYAGQLYFANEESGDEGRVFAVTMDGVAWQLPRLGLFSWENTIVAPTRGDTTVVVGNEDAAAGQLRVYWGTKRATGTEVERAGLTNGANHVLAVAGAAVTTDAAFRAAYGKGAAVPVTFAEQEWNASGAVQNAAAASAGLTLNRIEDGAFDPRHRNDYYFLTTEGGDKTVPAGAPTRDGGGLWRLRFTDVDRPELGGTLTLLLDGSEAPYLNKPDNMAIDRHGNLLIQEDPGNNAHLARIVAYRIADGARGVVAQFDPALFSAGGAGFVTQDEESSGIVDVSQQVGKPHAFLFDAQVHTPSTDLELVEPGQLLSLTVRSWGQVYRGGAR